MKQKVITVKDQQYIVYQYSMDIGLEGFDIVLKTFGEPLVMFLGELIQNEKDITVTDILKKDINVSEIMKNLGVFIKNFNQGTTLQIVKYFLDRPDYIKHGGKDIDIQTVYANYGFPHVIELLVQVIIYQYADFLDYGTGKPQSKTSKIATQTRQAPIPLKV